MWSGNKNGIHFRSLSVMNVIELQIELFCSISSIVSFQKQLFLVILNLFGCLLVKCKAYNHSCI